MPIFNSSPKPLALEFYIPKTPEPNHTINPAPNYSSTSYLVDNSIDEFLSLNTSTSPNNQRIGQNVNGVPVTYFIDSKANAITFNNLGSSVVLYCGRNSYPCLYENNYKNFNPKRSNGNAFIDLRLNHNRLFVEQNAQESTINRSYLRQFYAEQFRQLSTQTPPVSLGYFFYQKAIKRHFSFNSLSNYMGFTNSQQWFWNPLAPIPNISFTQLNDPNDYISGIKSVGIFTSLSGNLSNDIHAAIDINTKHSLDAGDAANINVANPPFLQRGFLGNVIGGNSWLLTGIAAATQDIDVWSPTTITKGEVIVNRNVNITTLQNNLNVSVDTFNMDMDNWDVKIVKDDPNSNPSINSKSNTTLGPNQFILHDFIGTVNTFTKISL